MPQNGVIEGMSTLKLNGSDAQNGNEQIDAKRQEYLSWEDYFMSVAFLSAMRSKDPATQVMEAHFNFSLFSVLNTFSIQFRWALQLSMTKRRL